MEWNPSPVQPGTMETAPRGSGALRNAGDEIAAGEDKVDAPPSTGAPGDSSLISPVAIPAPASTSLSVQVPSSPQHSVQHPAPGTSFGRNYEQSQAPAADRTLYEKLTWEKTHGPCSQRGYHRWESGEFSKARLGPTDAAEANRTPAGGDDMDTSETISGKGGRAPVDGVLGSDIPTQSPGEGCRVGDLHLAFVVGKGVVKVHA